MRSMRWLCIAALVAAFGLAACGDDDDGGGSASSGSDGPVTIKIGRLLPQTGPFVEFAKIQVQGFDLAVKQINEKGEVKIEVVDADMGGAPPEAVAGYERLKRENVDLVFMNGGSSSQAAALAAATANDNLALFAAVGDPMKPKNPNAFNTLPHTPVQIPLATEAFWDKYGSQIKTAAYISASDYEVGIKSVAQRREFFEGKGVKTVLDEKIPGTSRDLTAVAGKVRAANPDLVVSDLAANMAVWAQQLKDTKYDGLNFAGAALASVGVTRSAPKAFEGYHAMQNWNPKAEELTATAKQFIEDFKAEYGIEPDGFSAAQFDGVLYVAAAAKATGSADAQKLSDWIRANAGPEGVTMSQLRFTPEQGLASPVYLTQVQPDGDQIPVAVREQGDQ